MIQNHPIIESINKNIDIAKNNLLNRCTAYYDLKTLGNITLKDIKEYYKQYGYQINLLYAMFGGTGVIEISWID